MDKADTTARGLIAKLADLVGAVRLPARAMRQDAGTDVVVDILFFRRRMGDAEGNGVDWIETGEAVASTDDRGAFQVNRYFLDRPAMVLGEHSCTTSPFGLVYTCEGPTGEALEAGLSAALDTLPKGIHQPRPDSFRRSSDQPMKFFTGSVADGATIREGSYLVTNHRLHQVIDGVPTEIAVKRPRSKGDGVPVRSAEIIEGLIPIRNAVREILRAQEHNRPYADAQVALRRAHSKFVRNFGPINLTEITTITDEDSGATKEIVRRPNLAPFADDPDVWLVASIEDYDQETGKARHGAIFSQRVIHPPAPPKIVTASDALTVCLHDTGRVDMDFIAEALGLTNDQVEADLAGAIFLNPETRLWETADAYLSGPVRTKLKAALAAAEIESRFAANVEALQAAQPTDLKPSEITARLGAPWIPPADIAAFCRETIAFNQRRIGEITQDLAVRQDTRGDNFALRLNGQRFNERKAAGSAILKAVLEAAWDEAAKVTGEIGGFPFSVRVTRDRKAAIMASHIVIQRDHFRDNVDMPDEPTALGVIARLESALGRFEAQREECEKRLAEATRRLADYEPRLGQPFDLAAELDAKRDELKAIDQALASKPEEDASSTAPAVEDVDFNQFIVLPPSDDDDVEPADELAEAA
jgi:hypothetical protein